MAVPIVLQRQIVGNFVAQIHQRGYSIAREVGRDQVVQAMGDPYFHVRNQCHAVPQSVRRAYLTIKSVPFNVHLSVTIHLHAQELIPTRW